MKDFIKWSFLFFCPILIGMISFECFLRNIPNDYSFKKNSLDLKSNETEVLFSGSSLIYYAINPEYIKRNAFNGAHISQSLNFDREILSKYEKKWDKLKYIIIPIDYFSMYTTLEEGIENWRVKNYNIYYGISTNTNYKSSLEIFNGKLLGNIVRAKKYLFDNDSDITCNQLGFGTNYNSKKSKDLIETGVIAAKRHTINIEKNKIIFSKNIETINSIIDFAKKRNIKLIFFTNPAYSTYRENLNLYQLDNTINAIKHISKENINVYYFNLLNDTTFISIDYYDADHLNEIGAKKLTLKIDSIINKIDSANSK